MPLILGIDAAWTSHHPSGVALLRHEACRTECLKVSHSYEGFIKAGGLTCEAKPLGLPANQLLKSAQSLAEGEQVSVIAIDMPMSLLPIAGRRTADVMVSQAWGARSCSTHSPSSSRPGRIADDARKAFEHLGFPLATQMTPAGSIPALLEVYPHPAIVRLLGLEERLPYKVARSGRYWRGASLDVRSQNLVQNLWNLKDGLSRQIHGLDDQIIVPELPKTLAELKAVEDMLDAVVSAWVGVKYLERAVESYGDQHCAIWIPT